MRLSEAITLVFREHSGLREKMDTARGYESDARQFCVFVRNPEIELVHIGQVEEFLREQEAAGFTRNGLQMRACALRKLFGTLRRLGYKVLDPDDIPLPRREFKEPKVATDEHISAIVEVFRNSPQRHLRVRNVAITMLLRDTGMRCGELQSLNIQDIDLEKKRAIIKTKKTRGMRPMRAVFWYDECNAALKEWIMERGQFLQKRNAKSEALFVVVHRDVGISRIGQSAIGIAFRKASRVAGIPTLNPHSFRHRKGHLLARNGANNSTISGVLGHSSLSSSYIYTIMNDRELEDAARQYGDEHR